MNGAKSASGERRRSRRLRLKLRARYLLPEGGGEHPCESVDVSTTGVSVASPMIPNLGERIVVYFDELGRLEGVVVRRNPASFSLSLKSPANVPSLGTFAEEPCASLARNPKKLSNAGGAGTP